VPERGELYVFEGPDGVGKTTLAQALTDELTSAGCRCEYLSFPGRDAGTLGRLVYDMHHDPGKFGLEVVDPASLQVLHVAAHLDAISGRILPTLESGRSIVLDRFWWSTLVYGIVSGVDRAYLDIMLDLEHRSWGGTLPTAAFLVSRSAPLREEGLAERWRELRDEYTRLAIEQAERYPVHIVVNDGPISKALDKILCTLEVPTARG
jgi:dTMP kinase